MPSLRTLAHALKKSSFFRSFVTVLTGTALAQAIGFAVSPIISRLFTPEDFGMFGVFTATAFTIGCGITLEYSQAVVLPKSTDKANDLFLASILATTAFTIIAIIGVLLFPGQLLDFLKTSNPWVLLLLVLAIFFNGVVQSGQGWCTRLHEFKRLSHSIVSRSAWANGSQLLLGAIGNMPWALPFSTVLGDAASSAQLGVATFAEVPQLRHRARLRAVLKSAWEYRDFPLYSATQNVLSAVTQGLPVILLTHHYGLSVGGAYAFGVRMVQIPLGFITRSLRQVFFKKASDIHIAAGDLFLLLIKMTGVLLAVVIVPALAVAMFGPQLFVLVFGEQWREAGEYIQLLVAWLAVAFCNLPAVLIARIIRIQHSMLLFDIITLAVSGAALVYSAGHYQVRTTILIQTLLGTLSNVVRIIYIGYAVSRSRLPAST